MTKAQARLYLAAARDDPLVAAWIRILDQHQLPPRAEVAPHDFAESFTDLFALDLVSAERFNAIEFKHQLSQLTPSAHDIDRALLRLGDLRADHLKEIFMDDKLGKLPDSKALALRGAGPHCSLSRADAFSPLAVPDAPAPLAMLVPSERESGVFDLLQPTPGSAPLARADLAATRRALEPRRTGLACQKVTEDDDAILDPRVYVRDFNMQVFCCGEEVELEFENGEEVGPVESSDAVMVEFMFSGRCPKCTGQKTVCEIRPLPSGGWG